jgi:hypothetical protein
LQAPVWAQDMAPSSTHAVAQQMPITHVPLEHWRFPVHAPPLGASAQTML